MSKRKRVSSALVIGFAAVVLFAGCAGQVSHEPSVKQEHSTGVSADVGNMVASSPISTSTDKGILGAEVKEMSVIQAESAVFFTLGSATLNHIEKQKLEVIAQRLAGDRKLHVMLFGYANDNGSSSYNLAVSDSRLTAVVEFLRKHGVQNMQIRAQALGSEKMASGCRSAACRQKFRRVDLVVSKAK